MNKLNNTNNALIDNYIQRVTELSHFTQRIPNEDELIKIARELGIREEEIDTAKRRSQDHFIRSQGYMKVQHWKEAIAELQEAVVFNPSNLDMLLNLVKSHFGLWQQSHKKEDEEKIRLRIKQCLEVKPDAEEPLLILAELDQKIKNRKFSLVVSGIIGTSLIGAGLVTFFISSIDPLFLLRKESKLDQLNRELTTEIQILKGDIYSLQKEVEQTKQINQNQTLTIEQQNQKIEQQRKDFEREIQMLNNMFLDVVNDLNKYLEKLEQQ
jgi:tetratricopeptide (TPR) repeat protein